MLQPAQVQLFILASLALLVVPGPAVLYIIARSVSQGRTAGLVSAAGVQVGASVHIVAAALGLSALLLSSALAFSIVKYLGAAYLLFVTLAVINDGVYALLAGSLGNRLRSNRRLWEARRAFAGTVYIGLGVTTALSGLDATS